MKSLLLAAALVASAAVPALAGSEFKEFNLENILRSLNGEPATADTKPDAVAKAEYEAARAAKAMPYIKAWAYARAIDRYCFVDHSLMMDDLANAAIKQDALIDPQGFATAVSPMDDVAVQAAKHLAGDQAACQPAIEFVERTITTLPDGELKQLVDDKYARDKAERQRKADEEKRRVAEAQRKADEERASQIASCKADIADATKREAEAAPNATGPWIGLKALVTKCAPLARFDPTALIARLDARIKAQAANESEAREAAEIKQAITVANSKGTCHFKGQPPVIIYRNGEASKISALQIGNAKPVRLYVGSDAATATVDGKEYILWEKGISLRVNGGKLIKGRCAWVGGE